ncbi:MAG: hypothetical protein ABII71_06560 [Candidatus Micrarchaeota archaeon]
MKKILAIFGFLLLSGVGFAAIGPIIVRPPVPTDPFLQARFNNADCWAGYGMDIISDAQGYYPDPPPAPAYLQTISDEIFAQRDILAGYLVDENVVAFNAQYLVVMSYVQQAKAAYRTEARYAIGQGWEARGDIITDFNGQRSNLISCLAMPVPG